MDIIIKPGAATSDAAQIESIIAQIENSMQVLDAAIKKTIPEGIQTAWSEEVKSNWQHYYSADVPEAINNMKLSATNLRKAVDAALKYSNQG